MSGGVKPKTPKRTAVATPDPDGRAMGTTERVAEIIRQGIRTSQFVPGQHLVEIDLTQRLQISRSSLREALRHLNGDGIVSMGRYRGTHICRLDRRAIDDLLEVLEQLVSLAARRATKAPLEKRRLLDAAVEASGKSLNGVDNGNPMLVRQTFYDTLFEISGNDELPRVTPLSRADLFRAQIRPYQSHEEQRKHAEGYGLIAQAVLSGDPVKAEAAVRAHFEATRQMVDRLPPQAVE
ncbi:GntR family transcriptional regulator [Aquisediminimonas sediminicola]|uniref:GntR family transcriptional regulator n=1 Tax=Alteraquisediminimonas sediminicola TaxID=2676787 RepID=UPI001C8D29A3|nr:GntR family transcriptional regulator [Aquisediminimonas sediminicola]